MAHATHITPQRRAPRYLARGTDTRADRVCLVCDQTFRSRGPGNRICPDCRARQDSVGIRQAPRLAHLPRKQVGSV